MEEVEILSSQPTQEDMDKVKQAVVLEKVKKREFQDSMGTYCHFDKEQ